jgi:hypothetical protein
MDTTQRPGTTPQARDRAIRLLRRLTIAAAAGGVGLAGLFAAAGAATIPAKSVAAVPSTTASSTTASSTTASSTTASSIQSSASTISSSGGGTTRAQAVSGGS